MAVHLRGSIVINRPIQEVWSYLANEANDPVWRHPYAKEVTRVGAGPTAVGTRFQGMLRNGPYVTEITHYEPPVRLSWRFVSYPSGPLREREGSYLLSAEGQSTRMTLEVAADTVGLLGTVLSFPLSILLRTVVGPQLLKQLKAAIEGRTTA